MLRIPVFRAVADRELSINSARANAEEIKEKKNHPIKIIFLKDNTSKTDACFQ